MWLFAGFVVICLLINEVSRSVRAYLQYRAGRLEGRLDDIESKLDAIAAELGLVEEED